MKRTLLTALICAAIVPAAFAYDSLESLMKDQQARQAEALKAYLAEHADAKDASQAESMLVFNLIGIDKKDEAIALLEKRYDRLAAKGKDVSLRELSGTCLMPLVQAYAEAGKKDKIKSLIERVQKDFADIEEKAMLERMTKQFEAQLKKPAVGDTMDIKFKAVDGRDVDLSAMKDKIVLVDFWATWCGPCVAELPNVKAAYEKFKGKGFDIVAISLDEDKDKLETFVKDKAIAWPQAFDGKGWQGDFPKQYGINGIPATFLIGKDGKIVATNLRGDALDKKLGELLGN